MSVGGGGSGRSPEEASQVALLSSCPTRRLLPPGRGALLRLVAEAASCRASRSPNARCRRAWSSWPETWEAVSSMTFPFRFDASFKVEELPEGQLAPDGAALEVSFLVGVSTGRNNRWCSTAVVVVVAVAADGATRPGRRRLAVAGVEADDCGTDIDDLRSRRSSALISSPAVVPRSFLVGEPLTRRGGGRRRRKDLRLSSLPLAEWFGGWWHSSSAIASKESSPFRGERGTESPSDEFGREVFDEKRESSCGSSMDPEESPLEESIKELQSRKCKRKRKRGKRCPPTGK